MNSIKTRVDYDVELKLVDGIWTISDTTFLFVSHQDNFANNINITQTTTLENGKIWSEWTKFEGKKGVRCITFTTDYNKKETVFTQREFADGVRKKATVNDSGKVDIQYFDSGNRLRKEEIIYEAIKKDKSPISRGF